MSSETNSELQAWNQWFERCAIEKCESAVANTLDTYIEAHWRYLAENRPDNHLKGKMVESAPSGELAAFLSLESRRLSAPNKAGKAYKQVILDAANKSRYPLGTIKRAMKTNLRDLLALQANSPKVLDEQADHQSVDALIGEDGSWHDHCNGHYFGSANLELTEVELHDYEVLAKQLASKCFEQLDQRQRTMLLYALDASAYMPLYHPALLALAECGKSQIYGARSNFTPSIMSFLRIQLPDEDRTGLNMLYFKLLVAMEPQLKNWILSEKSAAAFLTFLDDNNLGD